MKSFKNILLLIYLLILPNLYPVYSQPAKLNSVKNMNFVFSKKIFPRLEFRDAAASVEIWTKELLLETHIKYSVNNLYIESIDEVDKKYLDEKPDIIVTSIFEYLLNQGKMSSLIPTFLSSDGEGTIGVKYVILVHKNTGIKSLEDLKNKTISFVDDYSNAIPRLWLDVLLRGRGLSLSAKYFKKSFIAANGNQAILKTFFRQVDACVVPKRLLKTSYDLNPQLKSDLVILKMSKPFIAGVFFTNKNLGPSIRNDIIKSAKNVLSTKRGKQIALFFRTKRLIEYDPKYLDNIKNLIKQARKLKIEVKY